MLHKKCYNKVMGCNCKKIQEFENENGTLAEEGIVSRFSRFFTKLMLFILFLVLFLLISPLMFIILAYKLTLANNSQINLPRFLTHGFNHGKKLQNTH